MLRLYRLSGWLRDSRMDGDRIAEFWTESNLMDLAEQIGAIPEAAAP